MPERYFEECKQTSVDTAQWIHFHCTLGYAIGQCMASSATTLNVEVASFETPEMMCCFGMIHAILQVLLMCLSSTYLVLAKTQPMTSLGKSNPIGIPFNGPSILCLRLLTLCLKENQTCCKVS